MAAAAAVEEVQQNNTAQAEEGPLIRCVVVGDARGGKKCLAVRAQSGSFPSEPPGMSHSLLHYFGAAGQLRLFVVSPSAITHVQTALTAFKEPHDVRSIAYDHADVILFCFPIGCGDVTSACNAVMSQWGAELRYVARHTPVMLVGTMEDRLRSESARQRAYNAGLALARRLHAANYVQCSAEYGTGVDRVMNEALRLGRFALRGVEEARRRSQCRQRRRPGERRSNVPCRVM